ncbi:hypothetical protein A3G55_02785 [Candidatus Giovannonibacteria bacterium RIFCSPLOWO2_12_FULL_44_25]|uniref:Uncharacterized protein n=4 Tax=Parcubacteria group TaxID=1794811 RepID=A0A837INL9_9BACT|nr:MAG: hypothetical protein UW15_C0014G0022 [Parcubacteria group bacterium GW2011_GWC1_44_10]KKT57078.1 MAG: hypothetical protein UW49_C0008G0040 [Candidatus Giovannonibacteria bacterium GW2011_GWB1_44_23]KKT59515.1 MAG: hypothetical protein UW53_C0011G0044 [Candidatus Giovannonibacteria bacterium GW2011_GWA1_44_25]KKU13049.1 MAG: hypothetical protein UX18_C0003G0017 [Candidatus Azambacteria bacterium GW2011_GWC2_45_7b]OGF49962.1 MAG: hypothetical protein A2120_04610 [Candidatus Giovannonibact
MLFYLIIFVLSAGGIVTIILRNREEFAAFNFANFMEGLVADAKAAWHSHLRERSFTFLEKRLHNVRILALKAETRLFRAAKTIRGIKERNGNGGGANGNDHGNGADLNH